MKSELTTFLDSIVPAVNATLDQLLPAESVAPQQIHQAMRYSIFAPGKRLRPALCIAGFALTQNDHGPILPVACALEMVHTYSLVHDDLPAMDDDDFRRGLPSCHKKFGEAIAILAGDALLTLAFRTLSRIDTFPADRMLRAIEWLGRASGTESGMIAGQVFDLDAEGRPIEEVDLEQIHSSKTGALITASVTIGAYLGGSNDAELRATRRFGERLGLAFQIVDDILDETASIETLGKTGGKDRHQRKATYPARYGLSASRELAQKVTVEARDAVRPLGPRAQLLIDLADFLETRSH